MHHPTLSDFANAHGTTAEELREMMSSQDVIVHPETEVPPELADRLIKAMEFRDWRRRYEDEGLLCRS